MEIYRHLYGGVGQVCAPIIQTSVKFGDLEQLYHLLAFEKSRSNVAVLLIFEGALSSGANVFSP